MLIQEVVDELTKKLNFRNFKKNMNFKYLILAFCILFSGKAHSQFEEFTDLSLVYAEKKVKTIYMTSENMNGVYNVRSDGKVSDCTFDEIFESEKYRTEFYNIFDDNGQLIEDSTINFDGTYIKIYYSYFPTSKMKVVRTNIFNYSAYLDSAHSRQETEMTYDSVTNIATTKLINAMKNKEEYTTKVKYHFENGKLVYYESFCIGEFLNVQDIKFYYYGDSSATMSRFEKSCKDNVSKLIDTHLHILENGLTKEILKLNPDSSYTSVCKYNYDYY